MIDKYVTHFNEIAVIGGGSWATALVKILSEKEVKIRWWLRREDDIRHIETFRHNKRYLSSVEINLQKVKPMRQLDKVVENAELVILAVPSAFVRPVIESLGINGFRNKKVISAIKGMIAGENKVITDFLADSFEISHENLGVIAGPCHAEEVAMEKQSYLTIASSNKELAQQVAQTLQGKYIKATANSDIYGVEYCAIMKNIYAIACGMARGLNYGDNFQAVLVSNAMTEMKRFLKVIHPRKRKLHQSAYLGDLLVTAYSQFSRNRHFGMMLGQGYSVKAAQLDMGMVAEGYYAVKCIYEIAQKHNIDMPILKAMYYIIYERISPVPEFRILAGYLK
ncbi:MAG: NAD(P)H-dependent glycerol-3-phosphate dehydrogenase [Cytophagales bacterium]|nr:NAD(P)H-dependent glycerol-3-phosphate dehydrogenase [Cytophagales bacterium]MDW8383708.1 NAD(P)H-dependent glycerol-3-phosphate dehydrogenase [Flammeovirgaceae bacterium]